MQKVLETLIEKQPMNTFLYKRFLCIKRDRGDIVEAIKLLNSYLDKNQSDVEAWCQLSEFYSALGLNKEAIFCWEEVLLAHPHSFNVHCLYAELLFNDKAFTNAKVYFGQSIVLKKEKNSRALWGLVSKVHEGKQ